MTKNTSLGPGLFFILIFLSLFFDARSQSNVVDDQTKDPEIGIIEHLDEFLPDDVYLIGEDNQKVVLTDLIDKPTVLNLVYYRCPGICSPLMEGLADVMNKSDLKPGKDYQVLTISFDPTETIDLAVRKKTNYLNLTDKKDEIAKGWKFFISDSASIAKVTSAVGFKYKRTGNDFLHAASVMLISPDGKITRYLNGVYFLPFEFKMAVIEAGKGTSGPTINKILQYCYSYDPKGQTYVLNVTKLAGTMILFFAVSLFLFLIIKRRRKTI
jgi:protein SCO1/2